ncbi:adaptor protein MecA [Sporolactobacillus vineae]|uniref:adaptor protein MecA n=1 Tax=Sporolactobacillus vineae TaxID=444463 RepID=UPI000287DAA0|nr:adaptor protein MecA [Sporolactobacillus vineae]
MKIERIDDYTLKFYITYHDIEDRGFDRDEIWSNRDRSEELFWQIMDEAHHQVSFSIEGPLWIRVQAMEKGMEIIVTRAQVAKDGANLQLPDGNRQLEVPFSKKAEPDTGSQDGQGDFSETQTDDESLEDVADSSDDEDRALCFVIEFTDFEDLIALSHVLPPEDATESALYAYEGNYYVLVRFSDATSDEEEENALSRILEFGLDTHLTESVLEEYGKQIISDRTFETIKKNFPLIQ